MAKCKKCNLEKGSSFYKNDNTCKDCRCSLVRKRYLLKSKNKDWLNKERLRQRDKYNRLNYKEKQKIWDKDKPWKKTSIYKNLNRDLKIKKGFSAHHWNYNNSYLRDVIIIERFEHRRAHEFLLLDVDKKIYKTLDGVYLSTKEKHINYLKENKIIINN